MKRAIPFRCAVVFLAAAAILFYRMPERLLTGYLWAEDTRVFLAGAYERGWAGLFESYAAYMVTLPRFIAVVVTGTVGLGVVPLVLPWVCVATLGGAAVYTYSAARKIAWRSGVGSNGWAFALALAPLLVPNRGEVFLTITNLQWVLCPALIVLVWETFWQPESLVGHWSFFVRCACIFVLTTTGPYGAFIWPLSAAGFLFRRQGLREPRRLVAMVVYTVAVGTQAMTVLAARHPEKAPLNELPWIHDFLLHVIADMFIPPDMIAGTAHESIIGGILLGLIFLVILGTPKRYFCIFLSAFGVAIWASAMAWINSPELSFTWESVGTRYLYLPSVMLAWSLLLSGAAGRPWVRAICISLLAMMLMTAAGRFRAEQFGPWTLTPTAAGDTLTSPPDASWKVTAPR